MSIRLQFKSDPKASENGIWHDYPTNSDGSVPSFRMARMGSANPQYSRMISMFSDKNGERKLSQDENKAQNDELFASIVMLEWRDFQPEDRLTKAEYDALSDTARAEYKSGDGKELPYSKDAVMMILAAPEWRDLCHDWRSRALDASNYLADRTKRVAGN